MPSPTISVCIPTYNGAAFLAETLASIAAQTFDNYEVLIVDDGSTDETLAIAEAYGATDARVRIVRNAERAGSSARNANQCLRHARGEWIKFLFQDDLMAPTCLEQMLDAGQRGHLVIAWHDYRFEPGVDAATRGYYEGLPSLKDSLATDYASAGEFCDAVLTHWEVNFIGPTSSSFIHRDCFERYGTFNPHIATFPDLEFWVRVGNREGIATVPEVLVTFRVHNQSISAKLRGSRDEARDYEHSLETVVFHCLVAREPAYEHLRARALGHAPPIDLERLAAEMVLGTRWDAIDTRYRTRDRMRLEQWATFCAKHSVVQSVMRDVDATLPVWSKLKQYVKTRF